MEPYKRIETITKLPNYLYHYTSLDALINGIITSNGIELRCSHYAYLNDPNEMVIGEKFINHLLGQANISHPTRPRNDSYIFSLSKQKDFLPMWNMYGKGGKGVMLEIKTCEISNICRNVDSCLYCDKDGVLVGYSKSERIEQLVTFIKNAHTPNYPPKTMSLIVSHRLLDSICGMIKSSDFEYEKEVRAIFDGINTNIPSYYLKNNMVIPYITINLPKDAIRSIWIGPTQDKERTKKSLEMFLVSKGYNIEVLESAIQYRE